jgi:hypothetical protein
VIRDEQQAILLFLQRVAHDQQYQRWVLFIRTNIGGVLQAKPKLQASSGQTLSHSCDPNDVSALSRRGYIEPEVEPIGKGVGVTISPQGERLIANNFVEESAPAQGPQSVIFHGGTFGNVIAGVQGPASISGSPVTQNDLGELRGLLEQLIRAIDATEAPDEAKKDAKLEVGQVALELEKSRKDPGLLRQCFQHIRLAVVAGPGLVKGGAEVLENTDRIQHAIQSLGWFP